MSPLEAWRNADWSAALRERAVDRAARVYAGRYSPAELAPMTVFFESPAGRRFRDERPAIAVSVRDALAGPELEAEFREIVCRPRPPAGPVDGPDRFHVRIPQAEPRAAPPRPAWCDAPQPD